MILVTGANGLVGSHLIAELLQQNKQVRALYRNNLPLITHQNLEWFQGDILDIIGLEEAMEGITQVYHCAAIVSFNPNEKKILYQTNIEGTANVVNGCLDMGIEKLVYISSVASLGKVLKNELTNEAAKWIESTNNSEYAKTKYLAEMEVWRGIGEGLNAVIVNPSIILGASDWMKGSAAIFKSVYDEFPWFTNGVNGFVDVVDVVVAMVQLMDSNITGERYILSGNNIVYKNLFTQIAVAFKKHPPHKKVTPLLAEMVWRLEAIKEKITGHKPLLTKETARTAQLKNYYDNSKLLKALPAFTFTSLEKSIHRICGELTEKYHLI